ncbi:MAG: YhhA family cyclophane-containing RiPP [Acidimicrobiales bacterium]
MGASRSCWHGDKRHGRQRPECRAGVPGRRRPRCPFLSQAVRRLVRWTWPEEAAMDQATTTEAEIVETLRAEEPEHPAVARLARRLGEEGSAAEAITSYDRMHHRHSRS